MGEHSDPPILRSFSRTMIARSDHELPSAVVPLRIDGDALALVLKSVDETAEPLA